MQTATVTTTTAATTATTATTATAATGTGTAEERLRRAVAAGGAPAHALDFDERHLVLLAPPRREVWIVDCLLHGRVLGTGRDPTADTAREQAAAQALAFLVGMHPAPVPASAPAPAPCPPPQGWVMQALAPPPPFLPTRTLGASWREDADPGRGRGRGGRHGSARGGGFGNSRWGQGRGGPMRPPPATYICNRCKVGGHWIHECPTLKKGRKRM